MMQNDYQIEQVATSAGLADLKRQWLDSLNGPQDGMWESFRDNAIHWAIRYQGNNIGYACEGEGKQLIQCYVSPRYLQDGERIFGQLLEVTQISSGMMGTNNPIYMSLALPFVKTLEVHTFLFTDELDASVEEKEGDLKLCRTEDVGRVVDFCHYSLGAPKEWLTQYIGRLVERGEVHVLEKEGKIVGSCEVRKSDSNLAYTDIGMIVSPDFRRQGYGTYLLSCAKAIAVQQGRQPICSCEKGNTGSLKAIQCCGFVSKHQLLSVGF